MAPGHRAEGVETGQDDIRQVVVVDDTQDIIKHHEKVLNSLMDQLDDYENRDHWQQPGPQTSFRLCWAYFTKFWENLHPTLSRWIGCIVHHSMLPKMQISQETLFVNYTDTQ